MKIVTTLSIGALLLGMAHFSLGDEGRGNGGGAARDALRIAAQGICPVSGLKLGEHGPPLKVVVGKQKQEVFLCCKACLQKQLDAKHWATIHANLARAQGKCPVMQKPLPRNAKSTVVNGQLVYICCPPCTKKLAKDPETYLKRIDSYYTASLQTGAVLR